MDPNGRTHPSLMRLDGGETTKAEPLDDMRLDEKETVDLIDVRIYEAGLQGRDPGAGTTTCVSKANARPASPSPAR